MRKEVKLGFTIGGILLAVVIVYVLVVPEKEQASVQLVDLNGNPITSPQESVTEEPSLTETTPPPIATPPSPVQEREDEAVAELPASPDEAESARPPGTAEDPDQVAATSPPPARPASDVDWDAVLSGADVLMTRTPSPTDSATEEGTDVFPGDELLPVEVAVATPPSGSVVEPEGLTEQDMTPPSLRSETSDTDSGFAPTTRPTARGGGSRTHVIQSGETLSSIAKAAYGNANFYPHIVRANPTIDPNRLKVGATIVLPDPSDVQPAAAVPAASGGQALAPVDSKSEYRVQSRDSLYSISMKLYGSPDRMDELYELNKQAIGDDRNRLKLNTVLKLPAPPTETASR